MTEREKTKKFNLTANIITDIDLIDYLVCNAEYFKTDIVVNSIEILVQFNKDNPSKDFFNSLNFRIQHDYYLINRENKIVFQRRTLLECFKK